jgi:hypothetical protein
LPAGLADEYIRAAKKEWQDGQWPLVIVTRTAASSEKLYNGIKNALSKHPDFRQKILLFKASLGIECEAALPQINKGKTDVFRMIITSLEDSIGVNFWPWCAVYSTHIPDNVQDMEQLIGRSQRRDPAGPRRVGWPIGANGTYIEAEALYQYLRAQQPQSK